MSDQVWRAVEQVLRARAVQDYPVDILAAWKKCDVLTVVNSC